MPILTIRPAPRRIACPRWALALVALWLALVAIYQVSASIGPERPAPPLCTFRRLTGVPCPTCGTTRAALSLGRGDLVAAILLNPMVAAAGAVALVWLVARVGFGRSIALQLSRRGRRIAWAVAAALFMANWGYVIGRERGREPEASTARDVVETPGAPVTLTGPRPRPLGPAPP